MVTQRNLTAVCSFFVVLATATIACPVASAMGNWMHRKNLVDIDCPAGFSCFKLDHSWAESIETNFNSCTIDALQNYSSLAKNTFVCLDGQPGECASVRPAYDEQYAYTEAGSCTHTSAVTSCYRNMSPGTYAINGTCHQASNRAFENTSVPFIRNLPFAGGSTSTYFYGDCGSKAPLGSKYNCLSVC